MTRSKRKQTLKLQGRFYAFVGIVAAAIVAIVFLITFIRTTTVQIGELQFEINVPVVIIRDEQIISEENYGKANLLVQEGTRVEADASVARVFNWGYNEKISFELQEKRTTIQEYQENALIMDTPDANLSGINSSIISKGEEINKIIRSGDGNILAAERELQELMDQKRSYLNDTVIKDRQLEEFANEEAQLEERVQGASKVVSAPQAGVVSYFFDGSEGTLNAERLQDITFSDINEILNGNGQGVVRNTITDAQGITPLYRLINNFKWYILVNVDKPMIEFTQGNIFSISFDAVTGRVYEGTVVGRITEDQKYIYVLEILDDIGDLLSARRVNAKIFARFEGLKVPQSAVKVKQGQTGVELVDGRKKQFVPVTVKIERDSSAIIAPVDENNSPLVSGAEVET